MNERNSKTKVVARMIVTRRASARKIVVEVHGTSTFKTFYHWYSQEGRRHKKFMRTSQRGDGIFPHWLQAFDEPGLDVLGASLMTSLKDVDKVTVKIFNKRVYNDLLTRTPDNLPQAQRWGLDTKPRWARRDQGIPVRLPADYIPLQKRMDILTGVER